MTDPQIRRRPPLTLLALLPLLCAAAAAGAASAGDLQAQARGRRVAEAYCGQCHTLGPGPSPLADAPPFTMLHRRYPDGGGLEDLLGEGMIAPATPPEEAADASAHSVPRRPFLTPIKAVRGRGGHPGARRPMTMLDDLDTPIFDGRAAQLGYPLNAMCFSFNEAGNRARFTHDPEAYFNEFELGEDQRQTVRERDILRMIALGGNAYVGAQQTGLSRGDFQAKLQAQEA